MVSGAVAIKMIAEIVHPRLQSIFEGGAGSAQDDQPQDPDDQATHSR